MSMKSSIPLALTSLVTLVWGQAAAAAPVACAGGTIDISAAADTPSSLTPVTGTVFNVGQRAVFTAAAVGITPTSFAWTIPGPHIKDYEDNLGTIQLALPPTVTNSDGLVPWSVTPLVASDLTSNSVSLYFKPSAAQSHPLTGGPEARTVELTVAVGATNCTVSMPVTVERSLTDPDKQPEDFYTSNHRTDTTTNAGFGHVIDEHMHWHQNVGGGVNGSWTQFLAWHTYFLNRFDQWRAEFGYSEVAPWYPGRPLPTGPEFDHPASLRQAYSPDSNRIPTYHTLAGGIGADPNVPGVFKLADYADLNTFNDAFESGTQPFPGYHGQIHCRIGSTAGGFFATSGTGFGSMCKASSPKDPMFWRWHGFIDRLYRNYCRTAGIACHAAVSPSANPWMGDNAADVSAGGVPPSPGPRWMSPDIWNRTAEVTSDACMPRTSPPNLNTVGGVTRNCGTEADHENPVAGNPNFLYATLRNTGSAPQRNVYAEVAVYIANASTGLSWPSDFTMLPESRQFITLNLEPGQVTSIGPLPWTPPSPTPSDHWCIYIRVLSVQEAPLVEGPIVDTNVMNSNSIAWRNLKIVNPGMKSMMMKFIVRNVRREEQRVTLDLAMPPELFRAGKLTLVLDPALQRALKGGQAELRGIKQVKANRFQLVEPKASLGGFKLPAQAMGATALSFEPNDPRDFREGDVVVTQRSSAGVDGGVTLRFQQKPKDPKDNDPARRN